MIDVVRETPAQARERWFNRQKQRVQQLVVDTTSTASWWLLPWRRRTSVEHARNHRWCFIVGCNNSGTTLVSELFDNSGEVSGFRYEGQRYTRALVRAARRGHERVWSEFLDELRLTESDSTECAGRLMHDWLLALPVPRKPVIVEKTTCNAVRMRWLQRVFPNSCFIALVRDGYAVVEGSYRKGEKDLVRAARHWNTVNRLIVEDGAAIDDFMLVKYEDLVANQAEHAEKLADFVGVSKAALVAAMEESYGASTLGSQGRQSIVNMNEHSRARLNADDMRVIHQEAAEMLDYFEYTR